LRADPVPVRGGSAGHRGPHRLTHLRALRQNNIIKALGGLSRSIASTGFAIPDSVVPGFIWDALDALLPLL